MTKLARTAIALAAGAAALVPAGPALADNPCKGQAPGPHCRPPCTWDVQVDPGDPQNGVLPTVTIGPSSC